MLTVAGLTKVFNRGTASERIALDGIDLTLEEGCFAVVIGGNGAGKSTLLNAIAGEIPVDRGQVTVAGTDVTRWPTQRRAGLIARVFQDPLVGTAGTMSIAENLMLAETRGARRGLRLAVDRRRRARYAEIVAEFNLGLESRLDASVSGLSGGQRQSLSLAMAILTPPRLLLLDEHCAALDPRTAETVMAATVAAVARHKLTALMVTHNMRDALAHGDRLIMMQAGRVRLDAAGDEKRALTIEGLIERFHLADDRLLLAG